MNNHNKTKDELIKDLQDLQKKYDDDAVLHKKTFTEFERNSHSITANTKVIKPFYDQDQTLIELNLANIELALQYEEKGKRAEELHLANIELAFQNEEKGKRAHELNLANIELAFQNEEKENRANELKLANIELAFQNGEKENRANELNLANIELAFQNEEKENRANELKLANIELAFQNGEKENRANELNLANIELAFQNEEKENRSNELHLANIELAFQNGEKGKRAVELAIAKVSLEESEAMFNAITTQTEEGIALANLNGNYKFVNQAFCLMMGYTENELLRMTVFNLLDENQPVDFFMEAKTKKKSSPVEVNLMRKDGVKIMADIIEIKIKIGMQEYILATVRDITERKLSEEKLQSLSQVVEQSPISVVITDTNGLIQYVNPKFVQKTGYSSQEVLGQNSRILKSWHTLHKKYKQLWQTLKAGDEWQGEFQNKKKNGELYWESTTIFPILDAKGITKQFIALEEDITYRKESELLLQQKKHEIEVQNEEYKQLNAELLIAKNHAEKSDRLKSAFLANMSHEIRTPMNGILGFAGLLREPMLSGEEQKEYIDIIEKSGARMLNIINDIIDISKIESGLMTVNLIESNINDQIEYIYTFFKTEVESKGMKLSYIKSLNSIDSITKTDSEKVYAILTNLVKNAIKYSNKGSIEFGYMKKGKYLDFFVNDTGIGIDKDRQKVIFERFIQADIHNRMSIQGAGLGLSISKAFVEMLGGKIWVKSKVGIGSSFHFTIPYNTIANIETVLAIILPETESNNPIKKLKTLIVEDDAISKLLITKVVTKYSHEVLCVNTGVKAIETCLKNPDIDLVLMDINMPEMNGYEATKQIRQFNKKIIIIAQTANAFASDKIEAINSGCSDYMTKPINLDVFNVLMQRYFT